MAASSAAETFVGMGCRWGRVFRGRLAWVAGPLDTRGRVSALGEAIWKGGPGGEDEPRENKGSTSSDCVFWPKASVEHILANGPRETS